MVDKSFVEIYDKFKLRFYRSVFELVREREGSLSAMEAFSLEVINMLSEPTVGQFADFLNISQSNATYQQPNKEGLSGTAELPDRPAGISPRPLGEIL